MRISIAGLGVMGKNHLRMAKKKGFEINSIYDPETHDMEYEKFIVSLKNSDGLIVSSPTKYHVDIICDAMLENRNLKILCEKPVTDNISDNRLRKIVKKYNNSILIGQIERFNPVCMTVKELLREHQEIIQIKTKRVGNTPAREKISCRKDIGIHDLDFCCFIIEKIPEKINIISDNRSFHENLYYNIGETHVCNEVSWRYPKKDRTFEILTENGLFVGHFYNQTLEFVDWTGISREIKIKKQEPLFYELEHFSEMIKNNDEPKVKVSDNLNLLSLLEFGKL